MSKLDLSKIDLDSLGAIASEDVTPSIEVLVISIIVLIIAILIAIYASKKFRSMDWFHTNIKILMASISGWGIWCFVVFSYNKLFEAYLDLGLWFTLPPFCFALIMIWYRYFFTSK